MSRLDALRDAVSGRLLLPGDDGFEDGCLPVNERFRDVLPAAVLAVASAADVAAALRWSRSAGVPVVARGGGHGYAGTSVGPGLVLDLRGLSSVRFDGDLVTVGGGTLMGTLSAALGERDRVLPLGNSDDVGIGGLVLGGGVSVVSRAFGLTCDALVSTDVVMPGGRLVTASEAEHPDLFWAARGGGGGLLGVHTSFTLRTRPTPPAASTCLLLWDREHAVEVVAAAQRVMLDAPGAFSARIGLSRAAGEDGQVSVVGLHLGPAAELRELLAPVLAAAPAARADVADRTYADAMEFFRHRTAGGAFAVRTRIATEPVADEGIRTLADAVDRWPGGENPDGAGFALFAWGGAIGDVAADATAFSHRDARFLLSLDTSWRPGEPDAAVAANLAWLHALHRDTAKFATDGAYVNFADPDLEDPAAAYFGRNAARLAEVRSRHRDGTV